VKSQKFTFARPIPIFSSDWRIENWYNSNFLYVHLGNEIHAERNQICNKSQLFFFQKTNDGSASVGL
jgi:hypothetical protein